MKKSMQNYKDNFSYKNSKMIGAWSYKYSRYPAKQLVCTKILHLWMLATWQTSQSYNLILHRDWSLAQKPSLGS